MSQNYPNPFNPTTVIEYSIPNESKISLKIYDVLGREILSLVNGVKSAGKYKVNWNASNMASGVYIARIEAAEFSKSIQMLLLK